MTDFIQLFDRSEVSDLKLVSLNVARPQLTVYNGTTINTGIFKKPVSGPIPLRKLNLDGDRQADLSVHGGPNKAVYAYPSEHYPYWRQELPGTDLPYGHFGENFTTEGLSEDDLHIGDRLQIGSSIVMVRQPRTPCYKLAAKFRRDDMIKRFLIKRAQRILFLRRTGRHRRCRRHVRIAHPKQRRRHDRGNESPPGQRPLRSRFTP
jgi:MOSC domain-containing protein YiiM